MMSASTVPVPQWPILATTAMGLLLHGSLSLLQPYAHHGLLMLGLFIWATLPYLINQLLGYRAHILPVSRLAAGLALLVADLLNISAVMMATGPADALAHQLLMPLVSLLLVLPLGLLGGYLYQQHCRHSQMESRYHHGHLHSHPRHHH